MALKKKKGLLHKDLHPDTESVAVGSGIAVIFALFFKTLLIAIPVGLAFALAHRHGVDHHKKKGKKTKK